MTTYEIIKAIENDYALDPEAYPRLGDFINRDGSLVDPPPAGDRLGQCIVAELTECHHPLMPHANRTAAAVWFISTLVYQLQAVADKLAELGRRTNH